MQFLETNPLNPISGNSDSCWCVDHSKVYRVPCKWYSAGSVITSHHIIFYTKFFYVIGKRHPTHYLWITYQSTNLHVFSVFVEGAQNSYQVYCTDRQACRFFKPDITDRLLLYINMFRSWFMMDIDTQVDAQNFFWTFCTSSLWVQIDLCVDFKTVSREKIPCLETSRKHHF